MNRRNTDKRKGEDVATSVRDRNLEQQRYRASGLNPGESGDRAVVSRRFRAGDPGTAGYRPPKRRFAASVPRTARMGAGVRTGRSTMGDFERLEHLNNLSVLFFIFPVLPSWVIK